MTKSAIAEILDEAYLDGAAVLYMRTRHRLLYGVVIARSLYLEVATQDLFGLGIWSVGDTRPSTGGSQDFPGVIREFVPNVTFASHPIRPCHVLGNDRLHFLGAQCVP